MLRLKKVREYAVRPAAPYHFDGNVHKPSHFPTPDRAWEPGKYWQTLLWRGRAYGILLENKGTPWRPEIPVTVYSERRPGKRALQELEEEIGYRFNFWQDVSGFYKKYRADQKIGGLVKKWAGMKPLYFYSLHELLVVYVALQNATVRRTVQMMDNLFREYGSEARFAGKTLAVWWPPEKITLESSEQELRRLKLGYRAKTIMRLSEQFASGEVREADVRGKDRETVRGKMLGLYGIGPASAEYLLFEYSYFLDGLKLIPPWEQKIMSRLLFNKPLVPVGKILAFFKKYEGYDRLAFHVLWEDLFWRHSRKRIQWLDKEIRM